MQGTGTGKASDASVVVNAPVTDEQAAEHRRLVDAVKSAKARLARQQAFTKAAERQLADAEAALAAEGA